MQGNRLNVSNTGAVSKDTNSFTGSKLSIANGGTDSTTFNGLYRIMCYNGTNIIGHTGVTIDPDGKYLNNRTPLFVAVPTANLNNVCGNDVTYVLELSSEIIDSASNYNTSTYKFTAPINGHYQFHASILRLNTGTSTYANALIRFIRPSLGNIFLTTEKPINASLPTDTYTINDIMYMQSGDTAQLEIIVEGGTQNINLSGGVFNLYTFFSGYLLG